MLLNVKTDINLYNDGYIFDQQKKKYRSMAPTMFLTVEDINHINTLGENYAVIEHEVYENNRLIKQMKGLT